MKNQLEVRSLRRGEESLWVSLGVLENEKETRRAKLALYLAQNPTLHPENYLVAIVNDQVVGRMSGVLETTGYMAIKMVLARGVEQTEVSRALFQSVRPFGLLQALSWEDREDDQEWREILKTNQFAISQEKAYYRRDIRDYQVSSPAPLTFRSMHQVGRDEMLRVLGLVYFDNRNRNFTTPEADLISHQESAGDLFDPKTWFIAYLDNVPAGVLLPQRFPDTPQEGTLMCFGVVGQFRGRGFGKALHSKGLEILSQQGAIDYLGSTDIQNQAMIQVFEANGCTKIGIRTTHLSPSDFEL